MSGASVRRKIAILLPPFAGLLLVGTLLPGGPWGPGRVLLLVFLETVLLALAAPVARCALTVAALAGAGAILSLALALLVAPSHLLPAGLAHLLLLVWGGALASLAGLLERGVGERAAALAGMALGLLLALSPLWVDLVLDGLGPGAARGRALQVALVLSPPTSLSSSLFGIDWLREGSLYSSARFVSSMPFRYPSWATSSVVFGVAWGTLLAADRLLARKKRAAPPVEAPGEPA